MVDRRVMNAYGEALDESLIDAFRYGLSGKLFRPGDDGYDSSRRIFNAMVDKHPALIVKCAGVADVRNAVNFARENKLILAVRGGGHNVAGNAVCDGGLVVDLSTMKGIRIDPVRRTARAEPGVTWGELDHETQALGLATTGGVVSTTGIGGLTLGGGFGWLASKHGLACDNLISADVVTADGSFLTSSLDENQDLFWGLRGGGGNFGVVTSFEYRLHRIGKVLGGLVAWPLSRAKDVLEFLRDFSSDTPDELALAAGMFPMPDGAPAIEVVACYAGPIEEGERVVRPLREFGPPVADLIKPMAYEEVQKMLDPSYPAGQYHYWKSGFFKDFSDEIIETIVAQTRLLPKMEPGGGVIIEFFSGEASRVKSDATAFSHRGTLYNFTIVSVARDSAELEKVLPWMRGFWNSIEPLLTNRVYVNYLSQEGEERAKAAYGENYPRLVELKNKYDPANLFRVNQNIKPPVSKTAD